MILVYLSSEDTIIRIAQLALFNKKMKTLISTLLFILVFQTLTAGHFTSGETRISLNGFWQFRTDPQQNGEAQQWYSAGYDDKTWNKTEVPGSWESENETVNYIGKAWYRTTFNAPEKKRQTCLS